jgi:hypothetical protein
MQDNSPSPTTNRTKLFTSVKQHSIEDILRSSGLTLLCKYVLETLEGKSIPLVKVRNGSQIFFLFITKDETLYGNQGGCEVVMRLGENVASEQQMTYYKYLAPENIGVLHESREGYLLTIRVGLEKVVMSYDCIGMTDNTYYPVVLFDHIRNGSIVRGNLAAADKYLHESTVEHLRKGLMAYREQVKNVMTETIRTIDLLLQGEANREVRAEKLANFRTIFDSREVAGKLMEEDRVRRDQGMIYMRYLRDIEPGLYSYMHNIMEDRDELAAKEEKIEEVKKDVLAMNLWG